MSLFSSNNSYLGIDIGSSGIKMAEFKKEKGQLKLASYGFTENLKELNKEDWHEDTSYVADVMNKVLKDAGAVSRNAVSALPTFSVFSSVINLFNVSPKDIPSAIRWEAKKIIPLPLEDMVLDWKIISEKGEKEKKDSVMILLTGAPTSLVKKYINFFKEAKINLLSLETETFSLVRSLVGNDKSVVMIVEMGSSTTDITIVEKSIPILSRSIDIGGLTISKAISNNLNIGLERAEQFKYDMGMSSEISGNNNAIPQTIIKAINPVINEIKYLSNLFQSKNDKKIEKIILSGGSSLISDFDVYLSKILDMKIIIGDPWSRVSCPVELKPVLDEIGPGMSVAIGLAMREVE